MNWQGAFTRGTDYVPDVEMSIGIMTTIVSPEPASVGLRLSQAFVWAQLSGSWMPACALPGPDHFLQGVGQAPNNPEFTILRQIQMRSDTAPQGNVRRCAHGIGRKHSLRAGKHEGHHHETAAR